MKAVLKKLTSFQIILLGFTAVIFTGAVLLSLPAASVSGESTGFFDALFTSVSAACVTGLYTFDTATYWSGFGQTVILILIQIGGLGVVSSAMAIVWLTGKRINLKQRSTMQEAVSAQHVGGVVKFTGFIMTVTFISELVGCLLYMPVFCKEYGFLKGLWFSVFHSVSAFCNAGIDLMGAKEQLPSFTSYTGNILLNVTTMLLVICGGLGFATWEDIKNHRHHFKKYRMQSKVILVTTGVLLVVPMIYFFFVEFIHWEDMTLKEKILASAFHSVSPRTAGFYTVDISSMNQGTIGVIIVLMFIGGSTGSTAGGMKTNTFAVLVSSALSVFKHRGETDFFGRRIDDDNIHRASALLMLYLTLFITGGVAMCVIEELPLLDCMLESASAITTVGYSTGITVQLGKFSRCILMGLMFIGRIGGLTFMFAGSMHDKKKFSKLPLDKISIG